MIELVAFLGNYGREYEKTRHNVAWYFEDSLPFAGKLNWQKKFKGQFASITPSELANWACESKICSTKEGMPVKVPEEAPAHIYFLLKKILLNQICLVMILKKDIYLHFHLQYHMSVFYPHHFFQAAKNESFHHFSLLQQKCIFLHQADIFQYKLHFLQNQLYQLHELM